MYCNNQVITSYQTPSPTSPEPSNRLVQSGAGTGGGTSVAVTYTSPSSLYRQSGMQSQLKITISPHGLFLEFTIYKTPKYLNSSIFY